MSKKLLYVAIWLLGLFFLSFLFKGQAGKPYLYQGKLTQDLGGPFESSNSNSRYALVMSLVDHRSFVFDLNLAKFSSPDVAKSYGRYFSIFTPGVSFLAVPLYILGKYLQAPQFWTYSLNIILACVNISLIFLILRKLKFEPLISLFTGLLFIFTTNAYTYAGTLTQHHAVTASLLSLIFLTLFPSNIINNIIFGLIWGVGLMMDIPFAFISLPLLINFIYRHLKFQPFKLIHLVNWNILTALIGLTFPIFVFAYYNYHTTGSYMLLAQSVGQSYDFKDLPADFQVSLLAASPSAKPTTHNLFAVYRPRHLVQGLYTFMLSDERSIFIYAPTILFSLLGYFYYLKSKHYSQLHPAFAASILGLISYSMFGDPWGGWSFGPRYLIPSFAVLFLFTPYALIKFSSSRLFAAILIVIITLGTYLNILAGLTTNLVPPHQEAEFLISKIPDTFIYNWQLINSNNTHSLIYHLYLSRYVSPLNFYLILSGLISVFLSVIYLLTRYETPANK